MSSNEPPSAWQSKHDSSKTDLTKAYLKLYNGLQLVGWTSACILTVTGTWTGPSVWTLAGNTVREPRSLDIL